MRTRLSLLLVLISVQAAAVDVSNRYRSPRNPERDVRKSTTLIVLHTTEAAAKGSLNKLSDRGECHYCVVEDGTIYRIIDRDREAFHAGRSMWNGKEDVDKFSIGIECVGYHDKEMPLAQLYAIRDLVRELKSMYKLSDNQVVSHGHVAYGSPNKWQKYKHRGRKRCGMLFTTPTVRRILDLKSRPAFDPDVKAKRLIVGDNYLNSVVYGRVDIMRGKYPATSLKPAQAKKAESGGIFNWFKPKNQPAKPGSKTVKPAEKPPAKTVSKSTFKQPPRTIDDLKERGFVRKGAVTKNLTASEIAGPKWNAADTYYTIRNKVVPGNVLDPAHIEKGMEVWMKK